MWWDFFEHSPFPAHEDFVSYPLLHSCSSSEGGIIVQDALSEVMEPIRLLYFSSFHSAPQTQLRAAGLQDMHV